MNPGNRLPMRRRTVMKSCCDMQIHSAFCFEVFWLRTFQPTSFSACHAAAWNQTQGEGLIKHLSIFVRMCMFTPFHMLVCLKKFGFSGGLSSLGARSIFKCASSIFILWQHLSPITIGRRILDKLIACESYSNLCRAGYRRSRSFRSFAMLYTVHVSVGDLYLTFLSTSLRWHCHVLEALSRCGRCCDSHLGHSGDGPQASVPSLPTCRPCLSCSFPGHL